MKKDVIKVVVCDDEPQILKELKRRVEDIFEGNGHRCIVDTYGKPEELVGKLEEGDVDICLLDIDMPRMTGMDIAGFINEKGISVVLIFVTGQDMLVYESFRYHPFAFIRKSMLDMELRDVLLRALAHIYEGEVFCVQVGGERIRLKLSEVLYVEGDGNYVHIQTVRERIRYRATLCGMEEMLGEKGFLRIHKGFLVNVGAVYRIGREELVLSSGEVLPIGRSNRNWVREKLLESFRD